MIGYGVQGAELRADDALSAPEGAQRRAAQLRVTRSGELPAVLAASDHRDNPSSVDEAFDEDFEARVVGEGMEITADLPVTRSGSGSFDALAAGEEGASEGDPRGLDTEERAAVIGPEAKRSAEDGPRAASSTPAAKVARSERPTPIILSPVVAARRPTPTEQWALKEDRVSVQRPSPAATNATLWIALAGIGMLLALAAFFLLR